MRFVVLLAALALVVVLPCVLGLNMTFVIENVTTSVTTYTPVSTSDNITNVVSEISTYKPPSTSDNITNVVSSVSAYAPVSSSENITNVVSSVSAYTPVSSTENITNVVTSVSAVPAIHSSASISLPVELEVTKPIGWNVIPVAPRYVFPLRGNIYRVTAVGDPACLEAEIRIPVFNMYTHIVASHVVSLRVNKSLASVRVDIRRTDTGVELYVNVTPLIWNLPQAINMSIRVRDLCIGLNTLNATVESISINRTYIAWISEKKVETTPGGRFAVRVRVLFVNTTVPAYRERIYANASLCGETDVNGYATCIAYAPAVPGTYTYLITAEHGVNLVKIQVVVRKPTLLPKIPLMYIVLGAAAAIILLIVILAAIIRRRRAETTVGEYV